MLLTLPHHNVIREERYSNSSRKLIEKIVLLGINLERRASLKFPLINFKCWPKRRILLFSALTLISKGLGLNSKLFQFDWLIELLSEVLCKVELEIILKVLKVESGEGLQKLKEDLIEAKKLQIFHLFRAKLRKDEVLKIKIFNQGLKPFLILLENRKQQIKHSRIQQQIQIHQKQQQINQQNNSKLEFELENLRLEDPNKIPNTLSRFLHIWRCLLNLRLVKSRTRKRLKTVVTGAWRKSTRVSTIAGIYHGKKIKLRLMNRWFSKKFGRSKEHQLTTKLNDHVARKRRMSMFLTKGEVVRSHALTAKGLFQLWRSELQGHKADFIYSNRLIGQVFKKMSGIVSLNQGRSQTSRLYNEIRLLKNFFYNWFTSVISDRFAFARDRIILTRNEIKIKSNFLEKWRRKSREIILIQQQSRQIQLSLNFRHLSKFFTDWKLLTKQHEARLIWTQNFRITENLRQFWGQWRIEAKNQISADTKYQFNLCKSNLNTWRTLFEVKQDRRFQLKRFFSLWKTFSQGGRGLRFLSGQGLLRKLTRLKAPNSTLSKALENSNYCASSSNYSQRIVEFYQWRNQFKQVLILNETANAFLLEKVKKSLQIWRLKTAHFNVVRSEPMRLKLKTFEIIRKSLNSRREKIDSLDSQLFHYYTHRAVQLESFYFQHWESAFQVTQVGKHCCLQILKHWEAKKRKDLFLKWQLQTAGIIFGKCKRITEQQGVFTRWRRSCSNERNRRSFRILGKHLKLWKQGLRKRNLENREIQFRHSRTKLFYYNNWKSLEIIHNQNWSRAYDFFYIVRGSRCFDIWKQKLQALQTVRIKTQTLLLLRAPLVRKPRIEHLMATAASLSDLTDKSSLNNFGKENSGGDQLILENLNIAELSV